jgi:hypothetical protein
MFSPALQQWTAARLLHVTTACLAMTTSACQANKPASPERGAQRSAERTASSNGNALAALVGHEAPRPPPAGWTEAFGALVGPIRGSEAGPPGAQPVESIGVDIWTRGATSAVVMSLIRPTSQGATSEVVDTLLVELPPRHMLIDLCEKNGVTDPELLAEVESDPGPAPHYTSKGSAFRLNRATRKIERIPAEGIRCAVRSFGVGPDK